MSQMCPNCEKGHLSPRSAVEQLSYNGSDISVPDIEFSICNSCNEEIVLPAHGKRNDVRFADAKRSADGLLTSVEISSCLEELGLNQREAARVFGGGVNAISRYLRGEVIQSLQMDLLLRLASASAPARAWLFEHAEFSCDWKKLDSTVLKVDFSDGAKVSRKRRATVTASQGTTRVVGSLSWAPLSNTRQ